jgi:hypothetical protein
LEQKEETERKKERKNREKSNLTLRTFFHFSKDGVEFGDAGWATLETGIGTN